MPGISPGGSGVTPFGLLPAYELPTAADWLTAAPANHTVQYGVNATSMASSAGVFTLVHAATATDWSGATFTGPGFTWNYNGETLPGSTGWFDVVARVRTTGNASGAFVTAGLCIYRTGVASNYVCARVGRSAGNDWGANWNFSGTGGNYSLTADNVNTDGVWVRLQQRGRLTIASYAVGGETRPASESAWTNMRVQTNQWPVNGVPITWEVSMHAVDTSGTGFTAVFDNIELNGAYGLGVYY